MMPSDFQCHLVKKAGKTGPKLHVGMHVLSYLTLKRTLIPVESIY